MADVADVADVAEEFGYTLFLSENFQRPYSSLPHLPHLPHLTVRSDSLLLFSFLVLSLFLSVSSMHATDGLAGREKEAESHRVTLLIKRIQFKRNET